MKATSVISPRIAIATAAVLMASGIATVQAQSLVATSSNVIATDTDLAPGCGGATFGGSSALGSAPQLGSNGTIVFRGRVTGTGVTPLNERAFFTGTTRSNLALLIRAGDQAPTLPGVTLNTSFSTTGIGDPCHLAESGKMLFGSSLFGTGVVSANDTAYFVGDAINGFTILAREGDAAPGTVGATMTGTFSAPGNQNVPFNNAGVTCFQTSLAGGDVVGTTNNAAWYEGTPGSLTLVRRKGDVLGDGSVIGSLGFISQLNASGQFLHEESLSTTVGTPPATTANNAVLFIYTPGFGNTQVVREGDAAPGTIGATFNLGSNSWNINGSANCFNAAGQVLLYCDLANGDTVLGVNDRSLYIGSTSGMTLVVRRGDVAPGTGGLTFDSFNSSSMNITNNGRIAFQATLAGAGVTTANDSCIFEGLPGSLTMTMREGDVAPNTGGLTFDSVSGIPMMHNELGQIVWNSKLLPGSIQGLWSSDPSLGLVEVFRLGDSVEVQPTIFKTTNVGASFTGNFSNGNAASVSLSADGTLAISLGFNDSTRAIVTVQIPHAALPVAYCTAGTTTNGCNAAISATSNPSLTSSVCQINVSNVEGNKSGIIFYGLVPAAVPWGAGSTSYLCVGSPQARTGAQTSTGTTNLCDGTMFLDWDAYQLANPGALGNPWVAGNKAYVQAWFRDPPAPRTTNLSNALELTYQP